MPNEPFTVVLPSAVVGQSGQLFQLPLSVGHRVQTAQLTVAPQRIPTVEQRQPIRLETGVQHLVEPSQHRKVYTLYVCVLCPWSPQL